MKLLHTLIFVGLVVGCNQKQDHKDDKAHNQHPNDSKGDHKHSPNEAAHTDGDHGQHSRTMLVELTVRTSGEIKAGQPTEFELWIPNGVGQPLKDYDTVHEAKVHLILIREGLDQFVHLHLNPDPTTGVIKVQHTFPVGGTYHLFADHQPTGKMPATGVSHVKVSGDNPTATPLKANLSENLSGDGLTAKVSVEKPIPKQEAKIRFELFASGKPVENLEQYMGERGHLVIVNEDATRYVHAHPLKVNPETKNMVLFEAEFPQAGLYKGWGQFKQAGQVRVIPFVVKVQ